MNYANLRSRLDRYARELVGKYETDMTALNDWKKERQQSTNHDAPHVGMTAQWMMDLETRNGIGYSVAKDITKADAESMSDGEYMERISVMLGEMAKGRVFYLIAKNEAAYDAMKSAADKIESLIDDAMRF